VSGNGQWVFHQRTYDGTEESAIIQNRQENIGDYPVRMHFSDQDRQGNEFGIIVASIYSEVTQ